MSISLVAVQIALRTQLLTVPSLPSGKAWEQASYTPAAGQPYLDEDFVPRPGSHDGIGGVGFVDTPGLYIIKWYAVSGQKLALAASAESVLARFTPGTMLQASDGTFVRIEGRPIAPSRGQVTDGGDGRAVVTITIPFRCTTSAPASL